MKKQRPKEPAVPVERNETIRQEILSLLGEQGISAKEISGAVHIAEKDVYDHLEHIDRSTHTTGNHLTIIPAECMKCGFVFKKRERLKKPGRCPVCRGEQIQDPLFSIRSELR